MKKIVTVTDLCCERCARRLVQNLLLCEKILGARADYKKNRIFLETPSELSDEELKEIFKAEGFEVVSIQIRKGLFC